MQTLFKMKSKKRPREKVTKGEPAIQNYIRHEYDVEIIRAYKELFKLIDKQESIGKEIIDGHYIQVFNKESAKEASITGAKEYCRRRKIDFDHYLRKDLSVIVDSKEQYYPHQLASTLLWFDTNKINGLLQYQKEKYKGKENFVEMIDHSIYESVKQKQKNLRIVNEKCLEKIMDWVNAERRGNIEKQKTLKSKKQLRNTFSEYLNNNVKDPVKRKLQSYIKKHYSNIKKPQDIAFLLQALKDLTYLDYTKHIETHLHKALENFLGDIGTRQALNTQLNNLAGASETKKATIKSHKDRIVSCLNQK